MTQRAIEDFDQIRKRQQEISGDEGLIVPLAIASGAQLDAWAKIANISRNYGEEDEFLRERIRQALK